MPDGIRDWFHHRLTNLIGPKGALIVIAVMTAGGLIAWHWDKVKGLPGVSALVSRISGLEIWQQRLPLADPERFSVAIAHLEHDQDQQYETLLIEVLKDFTGEGKTVQILRFDRTVSLSGTKPEESEQAGHDQARRYLHTSGATVLIWGLIHHLGGQSAPRLYWTTAQEAKRATEVYQLGLPGAAEQKSTLSRPVCWTPDP
jgi:hypothetical protein